MRYRFADVNYKMNYSYKIILTFKIANYKMNYSYKMILTFKIAGSLLLFISK